MSITFADYELELREARHCSHRLTAQRALDCETLKWLNSHRKHYGSQTLERFQIRQGVLDVYDRRLGFGNRSFVCSDPCVVIPVGPICRCYRYLRPKRERWVVSPAGYPAQWMGDLNFPEVILCEGEWDCMRLHDLGFANAITHTGGCGTWLPEWSLLFQRKCVWIVFDRDSMGQMGAAKVAARLSPMAREVRLIDLPLPGTPEANDISDFFWLGGDADEFKRILERARVYVPKKIFSIR